MPNTKEPKENYSKKEAADRMAAALRGARIAQPKPMKDKPKKRAVVETKEKKPGS